MASVLSLLSVAALANEANNLNYISFNVYSVSWSHKPRDFMAGCRALPSSLLLLSRAFTVTQPLSKGKGESEYDSLKDTLSSLPKEVIDEIALSSPADG